MTYPSPFVRLSDEVAAFAAPSFPPRRPLLDAVADLTHRIHEDLAYDQAATSVSTPVDEVLRLRRGVCQDFTHLEIACLRAMGLPARYVSGYLVTMPVPGKPKLVGADASHAWLAVYCPGARLGADRSDQRRRARPAAHHRRVGARLRRRHADARRDRRRQPPRPARLRRRVAARSATDAISRRAAPSASAAPATTTTTGGSGTSANADRQSE